MRKPAHSLIYSKKGVGLAEGWSQQGGGVILAHSSTLLWTLSGMRYHTLICY